MTRHVTREAHSPRYLDEEDIDPEKGDIAVCRCGLSDDHPFCDGSHRRTEDEGDGVYCYVDGERREIASVTFVDGETVSYGAVDDADEPTGEGDDGPTETDDEPTRTSDSELTETDDDESA